MFVILMIDNMPGMGVGIGLGISMKNLFLYFFIMLISVRAALTPGQLTFADLDVHLPFLFLMAYAALTWGILSAIDPTYGIMRGVVTFKSRLVDLYLFMFAFRYGVDSKEDYMWLIRMILITLMISSFVALIDFLNIPDLGIFGTYEGRLEGPIGEANQYGALLAFLIPVSISVMPQFTGRVTKWIWGFGIVITAILLIATGSRGALFALIVGSTVGVAYLRRYLDMKKVVIYAGIAFAVLTFLIILLILSNAGVLLEIINRSSSGGMDTASSGRLSIWTAALSVMAEWPLSFLVGYGWSSYEVSGIWKAAHNEYLDRWFELGIPGLLAYIVLLGTVISRAKSAIDNVSQNVGRILIGYVFGMLIIVINIFFVAIPDPWTVIWIITGLVMGLQAVEQSLDSTQSSSSV